MIGENIKQLRKENNMTQKDLADKLFITAQAVSRWENGEAEPSVSMIAEMAKIFQVPGDMILGITGFTAPPETIIQKEYVVQESPQPVIGVCEICNKPIYSADDIIRNPNKKIKIICRSCDNERKENEQKRMVGVAHSRRI